MALTFENLIDHNKAASLRLVVMMIAMMSLLGAAFALAYSGYVDHQFMWESAGFGAFLGGSLAVAGSLFTFYTGNHVIIGISNAYRVEYADDPILVNVVEEMAIAAGLPVPRIYAIPDSSPNAFATGRDPKHALIAITTGLRTKLSREELQAVIAHEMAHIKNYDIRLMMLIGVYAGIIVLMSDFFLRNHLDRTKNQLMFKRGNGKAVVTATKHGLWFHIGFVLAAIGLAWLAPIVAKLLQLAVSREREYLADATAVQLCRNPEALINALGKVTTDPDPLICDNRATEHMYIVNPDPVKRLQGPNKDSIWSTHPPLVKRIQKLRALVGQYQDDNAEQEFNERTLPPHATQPEQDEQDLSTSDHPAFELENDAPQ